MFTRNNIYVFKEIKGGDKILLILGEFEEKIELMIIQWFLFCDSSSLWIIEFHRIHLKILTLIPFLIFQ